MTNLALLLGCSRSFIIFDLETTGTDPQKDRIVQLGMRVHKLDGNIDAYHTLVNPGISIPKGASDVHGITDEVIRIGCARCKAPQSAHPHGHCETFKPVPRFSDIANNLHRGFSAAELAGFNHRRYDVPLLAAEFARCRLELDVSTACIVDASRLWQLLEPRTLSDAVEHFAGRKLSDAHDAMVDVEGTEAVLIAQLTKHQRSSSLPRTIRELHGAQWPRDPNWIDSEGKFMFINGVPCLNFGKHKGMPMKDCKNYLSWMYGAAFSPEVKRICDDAMRGKYPVKVGQEPEAQVFF